MNKKWMICSLAVAAALGTQMIGVVAYADDTTVAPAGDITLVNPLGNNATFIELLQHIFSEGTKIVAVIVPIIVIIGAFQMMFATGDPEKFAKGQKTILYSVIGFVIILMANGIVSIVKSLLTLK